MERTHSGNYRIRSIYFNGEMSTKWTDSDMSSVFYGQDINFIGAFAVSTLFNL